MIIVTLASIPSRFKYIDEILKSICTQTVKPDKVYLNVCNSYERFPGVPVDIAGLREQIAKLNHPEIEILVSSDYGPGTKLIGTLLHVNINDDDIIIVTDDDIIKKNDMIERLLWGIELGDTCSYCYFAEKFDGRHDDTLLKRPNLIQPNLPGYLSYAIRGKMCNGTGAGTDNSLVAGFFQMIALDKDIKYNDDTVITAYLRKRNAKFIWIKKDDEALFTNNNLHDIDALSFDENVLVRRMRVAFILDKNFDKIKVPQ